MGRILVPLSWLEQTMYWVVGMSAWTYTIYRVYHTSQELMPVLQNLNDGWSLLGGRKIDGADTTWDVYRTVVIWRVIVCIAWHETFSQIIRLCPVGRTTRKVLLLTVGVVCMSWAVSWRLVVFLAIKIVIVYLITLVVNSLLVVWAAVICDIVFSLHVMDEFLDIQDFAEDFMVLFIDGFTTFKIIAFASERIWFASRHGDQSTGLSAREGRGELQPLRMPQRQPPRSASISPLTSTDSTAAASSDCSSKPEARRSTSRSDVTDSASEILSCASVGATDCGSDSQSVGATEGGSHSQSVGATEGGSHSQSVGATEGGSHSQSVGATEGGSDSQSVGATEGGSHSQSVGATEGGSDSQSVGATEGGSDSQSVGATEGGSQSVGATEGGSDSQSVGATEGGSQSVGATEGGSHSQSVGATEGGSHSQSVGATEGGSDSPPLLRCPDLVDGLLYIFYMPFASPGLLVPFPIFLARIENPLPMTTGLLVDAGWLVVRLVFWFFFNDFLLHFLYFASLKSAEADLLQHLDKWTLIGVLYLQGQFMTCKYTLIYGLPYLLARLDGMWAPTPPACIAYIYRYSDMWRYFDGGMYTCLNRYLYRPLKGSKTGLLRHLWALFMCFMFMGIWHGATQHVMTWALVNCLVEMLEMAAVHLERTSFAKKYLLTRLSPVAMQRFRAARAVPLLLISLMVQAFFLGGTTFASVVVSRLYLEADSLLLGPIVLYCFIHISHHLQRLGYTKLSNSATTFRSCPQQDRKNE